MREGRIPMITFHFLTFALSLGLEMHEFEGHNIEKERHDAQITA